MGVMEPFFASSESLRSVAQRDRANFDNTLVHELGHHVNEHLNPDQFGTGDPAGRNFAADEAIAENYAQRHVKEATVPAYDTWVPGMYAGKKGPDKRWAPRSPAIRKSFVHRYAAERIADTQPGESMTKPKSWTPEAYQEFHDRFIRGGPFDV